MYSRAVANLPAPEIHYLRAAEGWLMLGDPQEARLEMQGIGESFARQPDVLEMHWRVSAALKQWIAALEIAQRLVELAPDRSLAWIHQSYTLHELQQTDEAWTLLLPVAERFPEEPTIAYNLACYACQLGMLQDSRHWLRKAARMASRDEILSSALSDPDLAPLRHELDMLLRVSKS
jgi:Flp pilus assembly protein TadD